MADNIHGSFISQKVNKVRWKPEGDSDSERFLTGSWDNEINDVTLWLYTNCTDNDEDLDLSPFPVLSYPHPGDITEIKFVDNTRFLVSSSTGSVQLIGIVDRTQTDPTRFNQLCSWNKIHYFPTGEESPCTGIAILHEDIATVGEDGRIVLLSTRQDDPLRVIDDADSCSLCCTTFLKHNELLTGNLRGQMKIWDLRSVSDKPETTFMLSEEQVGANCVTQHPSQRHLVLAGGDDGSLTVWDLRHNTFPVTLLSAHTQGVSEIHFHPDRPEHVFTCSNSGELWHWNTSSMARSSVLSTSNTDMSIEDNPWLSSDAAKHRMVVNNLMQTLHLPINSLDLNRSRLVCGCDNEAVYVIKNLF